MINSFCNFRSVGVTDKGVTEIARGCPLLQMINLAYCTEMTDESLRALSKCSSLKTLEIRGCPRVSSAGLSAIAVGCRQISKLDIKKCHDIDDAGMLPLARFSQNLRQVLESLSRPLMPVRVFWGHVGCVFSGRGKESHIQCVNLYM